MSRKGIFVASIRRTARDLVVSFGCPMVHLMDALLFGNKDVQVTVIVASTVNATQVR